MLKLDEEDYNPPKNVWFWDTENSKNYTLDEDPLINVEKPCLKYDQGKLRFDLIPAEIELALAETLTNGLKKYQENSWKNVETHRYIGAMRRHFNAWQQGEDINPESGLHHLKHALVNLAFICYLEAFKK